MTVTLEQKLTYGGLLTIATVLVTAGINWGLMTSQANSTSAEVALLKANTASATDLAAVKADVEDLKRFRFDDNSRMVRVETLLQEILSEVRTTSRIN
jgi:hypothetical protein